MQFLVHGRRLCNKLFGVPVRFGGMLLFPESSIP